MAPDQEPITPLVERIIHDARQATVLGRARNENRPADYLANTENLAQYGMLMAQALEVIVHRLAEEVDKLRSSGQ
jgi:hypothetical protein